MTRRFQGYQGDVGLVQVGRNVWPKDARRVQPSVDGRYTLAVGESTGHAHVIEGDVEVFETGTADAIQRWLQVGAKGAMLIHTSVDPDHYPIVFPEGLYAQTGVYEFTDEDERRVQD